MNGPTLNPQVALYVDDFLPYTHGWIYRQISDPVTNVKTVLCHQRSEEKIFPIARYVTSTRSGRLSEYIKGRFWFLFKYFSLSLDKKAIQAFGEELIAQKINLVHAHFGTNGVGIAPLCKRLNIPLVVTFHGFDISSAPLRWPAYRKQLQLLFDQIACAIAISEEMAERLIVIGCPKEKIKVSYLGVPVNKFTYIDRSQHKEPLVFLHAGRLTAKKGVPDLVRAFAKAFPNKGEAELWLAGDGEERKEVKETIHSTQSSDVKLLGRLTEEELQQARSKAHVFVINCRTDQAGTKEGLPIAILEACCTGMPVISTRHAGIPEAIQHEHTGFLVEEYDSNAFALAMQKMREASLRTQMGINANVLMREKFSLEKCNQELRRIYNEVLSH
ncbi:MAG: glycosyltransferase [Cytophagaceae bacterium]|jgi:glycosyltransferase involved in cell wall biosynthesis|nr:glycosyltransferase [Cytophagaceae bacterium]